MKETLLQEELSRQVEDARCKMQAEMDALLRKHHVEVASKDQLSSVVGKFRNAAFSKCARPCREKYKPIFACYCDDCCGRLVFLRCCQCVRRLRLMVIVVIVTYAASFSL